MNDRDLLRQQRLARVETFGTEHHGDWPADSDAATSFAKVAQINASLGISKVGQLRTPTSKQTLLDALWLDFKAIARTARGIAIDEPGFADPYRLPAGATESNITTHADALLKLLEDNNAPVDSGGDTPAQKTAKAALRARFIRHFIPADFVAHLRTDRDAIDTANQAKTSDNLEGVESTTDIDTLLLAGTQAVIRLDAMMQNLYATDPGKLRAWHAASRVERSPQRAKKTPAPNTASTPEKKP